MAKKSALLGGRIVKVENRSSFDKSCLNLLTTQVGTITPIRKQLLIPSSGRCRIPIHAELPPLAADVYLRTHLKMEAFFVPLRLCYGGFQSWFCGEPIWSEDTQSYKRAGLPCAFLSHHTDNSSSVVDNFSTSDLESCFGPGSLTDYLDVRLGKDGSGNFYVPSYDDAQQTLTQGNIYGLRLNLFPYIAYHLIYDHFYRNKSVSKPAFMPPAYGTSGVTANANIVSAHIPYLSFEYNPDVLLGTTYITGTNNDLSDFPSSNSYLYSDILLNGHSLFELRQRNYGDDYFTSARPTAQDGNPVAVQVDQNGRFTIASIRLQNALQEFSENQNYATPDFIQTNVARYGVAPSDGTVQKPILLGSADFPIYTKSVEMSSAAGYSSQSGISARNPWSNVGLIGSKAGLASGNGVFEFDFDVKEPGYLMVMATLVPEANYSSGIARDMFNFTKGASSLPDLPCSLLEHIGDEEIYSKELNALSNTYSIFGYNQRYLWHKIGSPNQVHGKFIYGEDLQAFSVQRVVISNAQISSGFLEVSKTDLDDVAAVNSGVSEYGVMLDCAIELFVSEPLVESALPALVNPASEHGRSVYLKGGGSKLS